MTKRFPWSLLAALIVSWGLTYVMGTAANIEESKNRFLAPPPEQAEYFTFGFKDSIADSLWLRWIQDNDTCQVYKGVEQPTAAITASPEYVNPRHKVCDFSWSFKMLDTVTRLAPKFKMPYEFGAITIAVLTEDYAGASVIFDRGVEQFPNDWEILYRAAYHFLYDMNDYDKAAALFNRAAQNGAPNWLSLLAARLYSKAGRIDVGLNTLKRYREAVKDSPEALKQVDQRIAELEKLRIEQGKDGQ